MKKVILRIALLVSITTSIVTIASPAWAVKLVLNPVSDVLYEAQSTAVTMVLDEIIICEVMDETCTVDIALSVDDDTRLSLSDDEISIAAEDWNDPVIFTATNISDESENTDAVVTITALIESNSEYYNGFEATKEITLTDINSTDSPGASFSSGSSTATVGQGDTLTINGNSFKPNTQVTATMYSTPLALGTFTTNSGGSFSGNVTIPSSASVGSHSIVLSGTNYAGSPSSVTLNLNVSGLPATGSSSTEIFVNALIIGGTGLFLMALSRRKTFKYLA